MMMVACMFLILSLLLFQVNESFILEWNLTSINSTIISFPILLEASSTLFMFTVSFISFNVLLFSKVYMSGDVNLQRFTKMVMLFISSMMLLILCPNMMMMLLGWDGLGITSFLLVIYYQNTRSLKSGFITLITNRVGDCLILFSIAIIMSQGQWNMFNMWKESIFFTSLLSLLILFAAMTKSAQFPFMAWLTCAMAAPTPVSALVHSSTLVTAGVFLLIRFYSFLSEFNYFTPILMWAGTVTMFMSASWAMSKKDIKETIALSTMSQLGLMMTTLSLGMTNMCFFHLLTHAMFKATMFMSAGMVITFKNHHQNFANMKMKTHSRTSAIAMVMSLVSMNAMFFMAGYYSKDAILEAVWYNPSLFIWVMFYFLSTAMTAAYSTRLWRAAVSTKISLKKFLRKNISQHSIKTHIMSNSFTITEIPLLLMMMMSTIMGSMTVWLLTVPSDSPMVPPELETFAPMAVLMGIVLINISSSSKKTKWSIKNIHKAFNNTIFTKSIKLMKKNTKPNFYFTYKMFIHNHYLMNFYKPMKNLSTSSRQSKYMNKLNYKNMNNRPTTEFIYTNYKLAKPFMILSNFMEKMLDLGAYKLLGPSSALYSLPFFTSKTLKFQESNINKILTMIMVITLLAFPMIM